MVLPINTFTIHNLVGFMLTGSLAVTFYLVYLGMGRRLLDLLAANFIACAAMMCLSSFLTDNLVPAGMSAWGWPGGPTADQLALSTLHYHRFGWAFSLLWMPAQLHFALCYCGSRNVLRRHIRLIYVLTVCVLPFIWTPTWFQARTEPVAPTSSWQVAIPWIPDIGWPLIPFLLTWFVQEGYVLTILWRSRRQPGPYLDGASKQWKLVFLAFLAQVLIALMDPISLVFEFTGISFIPIGSSVMGVLLATALIRSRIGAFRLRERMERERAALLESVQQPLVCFDTEFRVRWANQAAAESVHATVEQLIGTQACEVWGALGSGEMRPVEDAVRTARPHRREVRHPDDTTWIHHASPILDGQGHTLGAILLTMDITKLRRAEQELRAANVKILGAREEERSHVARELHDSVAQSAAALEMVLRAGAVHQEAGSPESRFLAKTADRCGDLVREVRMICHELYPPSLELLGLARTLAELADQYAEVGKDVTVSCGEPLRKARFSPDVEIALYRIAQEAVSNAMRHGRAHKIDIGLTHEAGLVVLRVVDDGVGFDPGDPQRRGIGMNSMRSRAEGVGGALNITSRPGRTCVQATVPAQPVSRRTRGDAASAASPS